MSYRYTPAAPRHAHRSNGAGDHLGDGDDAPAYASSSSTPTGRPPGGRKSSEAVNLNHLLNFTLPPRQPTSGLGAPAARRSKGYRNAAHHKEKYVNAQFRFILKPTTSHAAHLADPDVFFDWRHVLQVIVPTVGALALASGDNIDSRASKERSESMLCPICLGKPVAPRITRCGHVFCFPCAIHLFQLSDIPKTSKCPICGDTIQERMLKSVRWWEPTKVSPVDELLVGDLDEYESASQSAPHTLRMRLVRRPHLSTLALPRSTTWPSEAVPDTEAPWHFVPDVLTFSKLMLASADYMVSQLQANMRELEIERQALAGDELGVSFVDAAMRACGEQMDKARSELESPVLCKAESDAREALEELKERPEASAEPSTDALPAASPSKPRRRKANANPSYAGDAAYHYYQSASGANIFLHPLDIRILLAHFKSYAQFPNELIVRPEGADEGSINEDLRRRCKYLGHLQLGTDVVFLEADLEHTLGAEAVAPFEQALKQRRQRRRDRVRKDDRARAKWESKERESMPFVRQPLKEGDEDFLLALERSTLDAGASTMGSEMASSPPDSGFSGGSYPPSTRLSPNNLDAVVISTSPSNGWGSSRTFASTLHAPASNRPQTLRRKQEIDAETDQAWTAFMASAAAESTTAEATASDGVKAGGGGGGGKKKAKKVVLSMSGGGRGS